MCLLVKNSRLYLNVIFHPLRLSRCQEAPKKQQLALIHVIISLLKKCILSNSLLARLFGNYFRMNDFSLGKISVQLLILRWQCALVVIGKSQWRKLCM